MAVPWLAQVTPLVHSATQFAPPPPPTLGALEELFGRNLDLTIISTAMPGVWRHYETGAPQRSDVVSPRAWQGIDCRFADIGGRKVGLQVADWALDHNFRPDEGQDD